MDYKSFGNRCLFDAQNATEKLSKIGNPLERLSQVIDFEMFRPELEENMLNHDKKSSAGAKPYDVVMMFKVMLLQRYYNLSDEQVEYQIVDRISFKNFLGLSSGDKVPDARTLWLFRENLTEKGVVETLFEQFSNYLDGLGLFVNEGQMIDASFVEVPRQRNTREENQKIKAGEGSGLWHENLYKKRHKDIDARWRAKNDETYYGYKGHAKGDTKSKLIKKYKVTDASVHDSQATEDLLEERDQGQPLYADSAYSGKPIADMLASKSIENQIHEKGYKGHPLTDEQKASNNVKSKTRVRVEHIFGFIEQNMHAFYIRSIGIKRATSIIGLINLTYNICRYEQIVRLQLLPIKQ
ncbi:IS5 family transposase ISMac22 [Bacteroidia bacterium]|nr:IS5 family transposase ISMac22 [Bacteroidia bacterium]